MKGPTAVDGVTVGHWTDHRGGTGCTVVLFPEGTVASGEVRGGAPGTREWELLRPERLVNRIDAVVLAGGSAFGLAACDGVMRWCEARGRGFATAAGVVPIVVGAVVFDLLTGDAATRPDAEAGFAACDAATTGAVATGLVGAGTGATYDKWRGREHARAGGIGVGEEREGDVVVASLVVVNAFGGAAGSRPPAGGIVPDGAFGNTTIGVVVTNARLDKIGCLHAAQAGHDGLARALEPAHATVDGDALVAAATGAVEAPIDLVRLLAARAVEHAVRSIVS